jgi:hypothetical protein
LEHKNFKKCILLAGTLGAHTVGGFGRASIKVMKRGISGDDFIQLKTSNLK